MTVGEDRVRIDYNPTGDPLVDEIKRKSADLIDLCHQHIVTEPLPEAETNRRYHEAMDNYELGCIWACSAATQGAGGR